MIDSEVCNDKGEEFAVFRAFCAVVLALVLHTYAAYAVSRDNHGHSLPIVYGANPVRPSLRVRRAQSAGWLLSIYAALQLSNAFWSTQPWVGIGAAVAVLLLVNAVPSFIVTMLHNGRVPARK